MKTSTTEIPTPAAGEHSHWLVALIEPQRECSVRAWLWEQSSISSWLPVERVIRRRGVKQVKTAIDQPLLPGYLFIPALYFEHATLSMARGFRGFMHYERQDATPRLVMICDALLGPLRAIEANLSDPTTRRKYRPGQVVEWLETTLRGSLTTVVALEAHDHVRVEFGGLGTAVVPEDFIAPT
ncbi:MAG: hypothetical protein HZA68_07735 [Rhodovulum sp.]|nr:hypothetical protein [Rhodovulum sp.]